MEPCSVNRWQIIKNSLNNLSILEFEKGIFNNEKAVLLDVRTFEEYKNFHLENSIWLDYLSNNLADRIEELDKKLHYYVYCRTSRRSIRVCQIMKNAGFTFVYNLSDGIKDTSPHSEDQAEISK